MNIDDFLKERDQAGQEVAVTEIELSPSRQYHQRWGATVLVEPVAHRCLVRGRAGPRRDSADRG